MLFRSACTGFFGAIVGGIVVWVSQTGSFHLQPVGMSYAELAATLLTAVGVIVAIFGGVLALAAVWGFNQLKRDAIGAAHAAGSAEIKDHIKSGDIRDFIKGEIERLADEEFKSPRMNERINSRVDAVAFGQPDKDRLLDDEGGE